MAVVRSSCCGGGSVSRLASSTFRCGRPARVGRGCRGSLAHPLRTLADEAIPGSSTSRPRPALTPSPVEVGPSSTTAFHSRERLRRNKGSTEIGHREAPMTDGAHVGHDWGAGARSALWDATAAASQRGRARRLRSLQMFPLQSRLRDGNGVVASSVLNAGACRRSIGEVGVNTLVSGIDAVESRGSHDVSQRPSAHGSRCRPPTIVRNMHLRTMEATRIRAYL